MQLQKKQEMQISRLDRTSQITVGGSYPGQKISIYSNNYNVLNIKIWYSPF